VAQASPSPAPRYLTGSAGADLPSSVTDPSTVATAVVPSLPLYASPGAAAPEGHLANPNWLGAPLTLLVTGSQGNWIQAYVPLRPNESTAWFPSADVSLSTDHYHIQVSISAHALTLYRDNAPVFDTAVATGAPDSPTPTGSYFVAFIVKLTDPQDAYGPYALGTSAFSNTYYSFEGGPGQVGIHGTNQPWVIGQYASHGCIRLTNAAITTLATQVVPGTPVEISP
jgi:lipoprotein-anchoring transpeptidase ErfK/SrfK